MSGFERVFEASSLLVLPVWFLMIFVPGWRWTERLLRSWWTVLPPALLYSVLVVPELLSLLPLLAQPKLANIASLLGTKSGATIGWVHFLAFDLFVGRIVYWDAKEQGVPRWVTSAVLLAVFMLGPLGLALHFLTRTFSGAKAARRGAPA